MSANSQPKWSTIKPQLTSLNSPELLDIIKGLFDLSTDNRLFLAARLSPETLGAEALKPYRKRIVVQFFPSRGFGKLNLREARQAIRDYRKATSDMAGTLELMMIYLEQGTAFTREYGDIDEPFYNSLDSVLGEIAQLLTTPDGQPFYPEFSVRLQELKGVASAIGWGYGDSVREIVDELEAVWEQNQSAAETA